MASGPISPLIIEEYLAAGDERFLDALRQFHDPKRLVSIVEKWKRDHRPWARQQIFKYLALPLNAVNHQPVVKRLFKHAEQQYDNELMATFTVLFDRLVRRRRKTRHHYDWQTRQAWQEEYLVAPRNAIRAGIEGFQSGDDYFAEWRLFSYHTRYYLRRRAWRYYRRIGFQRPDEYPAAIARALQKYVDADLARGENLIDSWGLLHACFGTSDALKFGATHARLKPDRKLSDLAPAPYFPELWAKSTSSTILLSLLLDAQARIIRVWTMRMLRTDHLGNLTDVPTDLLVRMFDHADDEVQQFAAQLLESASGLDRWPLETWLRLLKTPNTAALETIAVMMRKHVAVQQLSLDQLIELAREAAVPVARLGLDYLKQIDFATPLQRSALANLAASRSAGVGRDISVFVLGILGTNEHYDVEQIIPFFDSLVQSVRQGAWDWLDGQRNQKNSRAYDDPALWSRLIESPFDDVRLRLVSELEHRTSLPGARIDSLSRIWTAVLLNIHRGGRAKLTALRQISAAIEGDPRDAEILLPVLAVALRSVRAAETRSGLAALVRVAEKHPAMSDAISREFPELQLGEPLTIAAGRPGVNVTFAYLGRSEMTGTGRHRALQLVPNLTRDPVAFDAPLLQPLRFREAVSALHDTVISDLRFKKKDKSAYVQWKQSQAGRSTEVRRQAYAEAMKEILARREQPVSPDIQQTYERGRRKYWKARQAYANYLYKHDYALWRKLMPCDPIITVADDAVLFECFSADESSYGCLSVNRTDGFGASPTLQLGTTNVDYSWDLYNHFQTLRSYRETRFLIDPAGFEVATHGSEQYREEKIDLPTSWLRGFMQIQSAMGTPAQRVSLSREAVYSILAFFKRRRAHVSPRAMRFELLPGEAPRIVLEPWEQPIVSRSTRYDGPSIEPVRVWGSRRLLVLSRLLPLAERFDVYLLGTGMPSFWVAAMGEMQLTLGLSGWTTNDWTRSASIDLLAPPAAPSPDMIENVAAAMRESRAATLAAIAQRLNIELPIAAAALRELAHAGQVIHDLPAGLYRWRQIMPKALGEAEIGPEHPELQGARQIMERNRADLKSREEAPSGGYVLGGEIDGCNTEIMLDPDQRIRRGKCVCMYYRKFALKNGPCRHMLALRWRASYSALEAYRASTWYNRLLGREERRH